jgi:hypothetical protein
VDQAIKSRIIDEDLVGEERKDGNLANFILNRLRCLR